MYAGRADRENRIKELKEDLGLDTFCLQSFDATDAAFRTGGVLYNLLISFRETVLPSCWFERRLRTLLEGLPIAAQLEWDLSEAAEAPPPPPGPANTPVLTVRPSLHATGFPPP